MIWILFSFFFVLYFDFLFSFSTSVFRMFVQYFRFYFVKQNKKPHKQKKIIFKTFRMQNSLTSMHSATLTPMHLRKAKLMFFWVRYPSSQVLKMYFPDIKFNKNNTAQLVKWFSNFRWVENFTINLFHSFDEYRIWWKEWEKINDKIWQIEKRCGEKMLKTCQFL